MSQKISSSRSKNPQEIEALTKLAVMAAAYFDWEEAAKINQKILKISENSVETLNRLAKAYISLGETQKAQKYYKKALGLDPYNVIAKRNLEKITKANGDIKNKNSNENAAKPQVNLSTLLENGHLTEMQKWFVVARVAEELEKIHSVRINEFGLFLAPI